MKNRKFENIFLIGSSLIGGAVVAIALTSLLGIHTFGDAIALVGSGIGFVATIGTIRAVNVHPAENVE